MVIKKIIPTYFILFSGLLLSFTHSADANTGTYYPNCSTSDVCIGLPLWDCDPSFDTCVGITCVPSDPNCPADEINCDNFSDCQTPYTGNVTADCYDPKTTCNPYYECTWISSVPSTAWGACNPINGLQSATSWNTTTVNAATCPNDVSLVRLCGVCSASAVNTEFANTAAITPALACEWGDKVQDITYPSVYDDNWNWKCTFSSDGGYGHAPAVSGVCSGLNSYIDIGLRIKDNLLPFPGVIKVAVEKQPNTCKSPYRIYKGGNVWCIGLTTNGAHSTLYTSASRAKMMSAGAPKFIMKLP